MQDTVGTAIIHVDLEYLPSLSRGVHERSVWGDLAFGGERGEERYQAWLLDQRSKGINVGESDDEDEDNNEDAAQKSSSSSSKEDEVSKLRQQLKHEYEEMWRSVTLKNYGAEMEKQKCAEYVFKHYVDLRDCFHALAETTQSSNSNSTSTSSNGSLSLAELTHWVWQHDLDQCSSGLRRSTGSDRDGEKNKAVLAKLDEERIIREIAFLVCFGEEKKEVVDADEEKQQDEGKGGRSTSTNGSKREIMKMTLPEFIEFLVRYAAFKVSLFVLS